MPADPTNQYLAALRETYKGGDATERSYYSALEEFRTYWRDGHAS